ncbi:hypothetical protein PUR29_16070 [Methylobacterium ajmalii]|uniref:Uncharacterized protein n=3 Tax=Methylobacterium TaxID=407 RepID=A0A0C6FEE3_9HYPH|nr:membrane protein of unknown function [Methylobacterium aquaticum]
MDRAAGRPHRTGRRGQALGVLSLAVLSLAGCVLLGGAALAGPLAVPLPAPFPPVRVLTLLVGLHLIGLSFGLGGATMLDFWILRWMRWGSLPPEIARIFLFVSKVVTVGLGLLWLSGLGFLAVYAVESPEKLANPKLWAKLVVVLALTVNGLLIHAVVLPGVLRDLSRPMLDGVSGVRTGIFLVSGAVSGVSWYAAFALGLMRELNGVVPTGLLLSLWLAGVLAASLAAYFYWLHLREWTLRHGARPARAGAPAGQAAEPPAGAVPMQDLSLQDLSPQDLSLQDLPPPAPEPAVPDVPPAAPPADVPAALPPVVAPPAGPARIPQDRILALSPSVPARARPSRRA